jgi:hypothetical protein
MTPIYCDITGKLISPAFGTKEPELNRDYYIVHNRVVSEEGMKQVDQIAFETMKANYYGHQYSFRMRQQVLAEVVKKFCYKIPNELPRHRYGEAK